MVKQRPRPKSETPKNTRSKYCWKHSDWMLTNHLEVTHLHRHLQRTGLPRYPHRQTLVHLAEGSMTEAPVSTQVTLVLKICPHCSISTAVEV